MPHQLYGEKLCIFLQIPLKTRLNNFDLYRILAIPETINSDKIQNKIAVMMGFETPFIAVSANRQKHILLSVLKGHGIIKIPDAYTGSGPNFEQKFKVLSCT